MMIPCFHTTLRLRYTVPQICVVFNALIWQWSLVVNSKHQETPPYRIVCCFSIIRIKGQGDSKSFSQESKLKQTISSCFCGLIWRLFLALQ